MPTDAQRRQQARAHHAEVQALNEKIAALTAENTRLEGLVYTPGLWRCAKCNFVLVQRNLNANSGTITARDQPGDKCPNCDVNLWRITERENARDNYETAERLHIELNEAKGFIALLEQQLAEALSEVQSLKLAEEGAKKAFAHVAQDKRDLEAELRKLEANLRSAHDIIRNQAKDKFLESKHDH